MTVDELLGIDGDAVVRGDGWRNQWGATFGGYVAAVAVHALERAAPPDQLLSFAAVSFVTPLRIAEARLAVETLRSGNTATSLSVRLEQRRRRSVPRGAPAAARAAGPALPRPHAPPRPAGARPVAARLLR